MARSDILSRDQVMVDFYGADKWTAIERLVDLVAKNRPGTDRAAVLSDVLDREKRGSTGLNNGIAIPHARTEGVERLVAAVGISREGVDFESADGQPCHLILLVLAPPSESTRYLKALAAVAVLSQDAAAMASIRNASNPDEVLNVFEGIRGLNLVQI